jgi:hypothetical protein
MACCRRFGRSPIGWKATVPDSFTQLSLNQKRQITTLVFANYPYNRVIANGTFLIS